MNISKFALRQTNPRTRLSLLGRYIHQVVLFGAFFYFLSASIPTLVIHFPEYMQVVSGRVGSTPQTNQSLIQQTEFINSTSAPNDTILILADEATELYLYTNHPRPLDIPGFGEMVVKTDIDKLESYLRHPTPGIKIYWDTSFRLATLVRTAISHPSHLTATSPFSSHWTNDRSRRPETHP